MFQNITPGFLKKLNDKLLINYPVLWISKIHLAVWHIVLLMLCSALFGLALPIDIRIDIQHELWYFLLTVLAIIIMCFWIYRYAIFNKEKNFGNYKWTDEYLNFSLVFTIILLILLIPVPFELIQNARVSSMFEKEEIIRDLNTLNENEPYLANSSYTYFEWYDSTNTVQYVNLKKLNPNGTAYFVPYFIKWDSLNFPEIKTAHQLIKAYKPIYDKSILLSKINAFVAVANKYKVKMDLTAEEMANRYLELIKKNKVQANEMNYYGSYQYELLTVFTNLYEAKYNRLFIFTADYRWTIFYFTLSITSFLLLFKMTKWRQFLLTIIILLLYPLITFILFELLSFGGYFKRGNLFTIGLLLLFLFSAITCFYYWKQKQVYKPFYNLFNQITYVSIIYIFLLVLSFIHDNTNIFHNHDYYNNALNYKMVEASEIPTVHNTDSYFQSYLDSYWREEYDRWMSIMKYSGIIIFISFLPIFKKLFVKQLSLPSKT
ncbi:MAG: hypothetical protein IPM51_04365 [Sphingobacteriaceae bacterium]|nr:hypothetical protein [Sphingobacteriaceae bacterium]